MHIFICEDSLTGIFSGVYDAWDSGYAHCENKLIAGEAWNLELFAEYRNIVPDTEKAKKVMRTLQKRMGREAYESICFAALSNAGDKADAIYHTIVRAFSLDREDLVFQDMHHPAVMRVFELGRAVGREVTHHYEFIRFRELKNGVLFARCTPKHRVTIPVAEHFSDRFPMEHFVILNATYKEAVVHAAGKGYFLCGSDGFGEEEISAYSGDEMMFEKGWRTYFDTMTIEERKNPALQRQLFPKRYWHDSVELADKG